MRKLFGFLVRLSILLAVGLWLADQPGTARIVWRGTVIECSAAVLALGVLLLGYGFYLLFRFWNLLRYGPERWRLLRQLQKLHDGHRHLTYGLAAVAGGHAAEAGRLAVAARKKLGDTTTTLLLQAQAAQLAHDHKSARALFRTLAASEEGAALGYRGLVNEARSEGNWDEVARLTHEIGAKTDMPWLDTVRFELAARRQAWDEAGETLGRIAKAKLLPPEILRRHRAALLIAASQKDAERGSLAPALELAEQAARQAPDWLPALINLARVQEEGGYRRAARRTVEKGWALHQHPQLAEVLMAGGRDALESCKEIEHLCRKTENQPASRLALAEAAFAADLWGVARKHLMQLVAADQATQAVYRLLARLERRESGDERAALQWLTKAAAAPPDATWLCTACGNAHQDWQASCRACNAFATLEWRRPGAGDTRALPREEDIL